MRSSLPFINVYKKKNLKSEVVTQLLYGETFKKIEELGSWIKIKNDLDYYKGFIKKKNFSFSHKNTHKICNLYAQLYNSPGINNRIQKKLSFGSKIKVLEKKGDFFRFDNVWIKKQDLKKIKYKIKNPFKNAVKFINVKYKWGHKSFRAVDCSGLIQLLLNFNNRFCPRDTKDQIKYFKNKIKFNNLRKNDLIFWKGHVALAISKKKIIHAYGPLKKVLIMDINYAIKRIKKTANLNIIGIRRIN